MNTVAAAVPILGLHHFAYRCRDAEETRHFYEDLLGLPLWHIIQSDVVPSTGEFCPYTHIFFRLRDGSFVAFFDLGDDQSSAPSPNTPDWVNHLALRVDSVAELEQVKARLRANDIDVIGVTDHHVFKSIYFFDPNGIRLELTAQLASEQQMLAESRHAHERLAEWSARKSEWRAQRAQGRGPAMLKPQRNDRPELTGLEHTPAETRSRAVPKTTTKSRLKAAAKPAAAAKSSAKSSIKASAKSSSKSSSRAAS